jgi:hypothetical protein
MGAKLKSKTHLQNTFFDFLKGFLRVGFKVFRSANMTPKKFFFYKNEKKISKTQNFTLISNPLKKLLKTKKVTV